MENQCFGTVLCSINWLSLLFPPVMFFLNSDVPVLSYKLCNTLAITPNHVRTPYSIQSTFTKKTVKDLSLKWKKKFWFLLLFLILAFVLCLLSFLNLNFLVKFSSATCIANGFLCSSNHHCRIGSFLGPISTLPQGNFAGGKMYYKNGFLPVIRITVHKGNFVSQSWDLNICDFQIILDKIWWEVVHITHQFISTTSWSLFELLLHIVFAVSLPILVTPY